MKSVYDVIMKVRATSSKNEKIAILTANAHNNALREFLRLCYEPRVNFYISKVPAPKAEVAEGPWEFNRELMECIVENLAGRKLTGNRAKDWLAFCHYQLENEWERELLTMLIERDVRAGFSESTINKVWADTVTDVPYMRCSLPKDAKLGQFPWASGVFSQIKADGMYANLSRHRDGSVTIESRNGSPFPIDAFDEIVADANDNLMPGWQSHGELLVARKKMSGLDYLPRQEGNGILNKILKGGDLALGLVIIFEAWDIIPLTAAVTKGKHEVPYELRFKQLRETWNLTRAVKIIETEIVYSWEQAQRHYQYALSRGLEGTIIKHPQMIWKDGTSKEQVKMKLEVEVELRVVGYNEGTGKAAGMLGSLQCESECGKLKVAVGSGFSDELRKDIWARKDLKVITAKSNSIMPPENKAHYSLFLPIFVEERLDKKVADTLERIIAQFEAAATA